MSKRNGRVTPLDEGERESSRGTSRVEKMRGGGKGEKKKDKREKEKRGGGRKIRLEMVPSAFVSLNRLSGD